MRRRLPLLALLALCVGAAALLSSCSFGGKSISASVNATKDPTLIRGATLFQQRCGTCHTLDAAGTEGTTANKADRERVDGPNLNARKETVEQVLYSIRNGGYSGAIMPQNIVVGEEARQVAEFVARYSGQQAKRTATPGQPAPSGF